MISNKLRGMPNSLGFKVTNSNRSINVMQLVRGMRERRIVKIDDKAKVYC